LQVILFANSLCDDAIVPKSQHQAFLNTAWGILRPCDPQQRMFLSFAAAPVVSKVFGILDNISHKGQTKRQRQLVKSL
jgi:hypothetical protein